MMTSSKIWRHFFFFFLNKIKDNILVIMHAKFEVNSFCVGILGMLKRYHGYPMHNRVK